MKKLTFILIAVFSLIVLANILSCSDKRDTAAKPTCIKVVTEGVDLSLKPLAGTNRKVHIPRSQTGTEVSVDPGTYQPANIKLLAEQDGINWQIQSRGPWGSLNNIKVQAGQTTELKLGPPLKIKTDVTRRGRTVLIGLSIFGQAGEKYSSVIMKNNQRQPPPGFKIIDEEGNTLTSGNFAYG